MNRIFYLNCASLYLLIFSTFVMSKQKWEMRTAIDLNQQSNSASGINPTRSFGEEERITSTTMNSLHYCPLLAKDSLPLPPGYNKLEIPINKQDGEFTPVNIALFIRSILNIDEKNGMLTLDTDFKVHWVDWKIFNSNFTYKTRTLDSDALEQIWKPDIFIDEMDSVVNTSILGKLVTLMFVGEEEGINGEIVYSARETIKLRCSMKFHYYPADTQICDYHIRSYSYNSTYMKLYWDVSDNFPQQSGVYLNDPYDPNYSILIEGVKPEVPNNNLYINERFDSSRIGNYSTLKFSIKIRRQLSYHIVQTYLPSVLLIFITWLCFLLPTNMVEARITISMTTLLTLTSMFSSVREQSPEVSYTMAIDIWMVFCIVCIFIALLLFAVIYWMKRYLERTFEKKSTYPSVNGLQIELNITMQTYKAIVKFSKVYAFPLFASIFLLFLFIYWVCLLYLSGYSNWYPDSRFNAKHRSHNNSQKLYQCFDEMNLEEC